MLITTRTPGLDPRVESYLVKHILEGLALASAPFFRQMKLPDLYESGIKFAPEPNHGEFEEFALPWVTLARKWGDCDDLIIYRLAQIISEGTKAKVRCAFYGNEMHVQIRHQNGSLEDPSQKLGAPTNWPKEILQC